MRIDEPDRQKAEDQVREMCDRLLTNPVIEEFRYELSEVARERLEPNGLFEPKVCLMPRSLPGPYRIKNF